MMKNRFYGALLVVATLFSCSKSSDPSPNANNGTAGSMARFALVGDYLYTVTSTNVKIFDVKDEKNPVYQVDRPLGINIETIFPLGNTLFLGSSSGMYIFDITNPTLPLQQSLYTHIFSCDPVVANDKFAYVTLSTTSSRCARGLNQLEVIDITNTKSPRLLQIYPMVKPQGMALNGNNLFVCDERAVTWFDTTNSPTLVKKALIEVQAHDAIVVGQTLMLIGEKGLRQYNISQAQPEFLSEIRIGQ